MGVLAGADYVGYYTPASKLIRIVGVFITSLGTVLIPRLSHYVKNDLQAEFDKMLKLSIQIIFLVGFPSAFGLYTIAPELIKACAGTKFIPSIILLRIMVPLIIIIAMTHFIGLQLLMTQGEDKKILISSFVGLAVSILLNIGLIPVYKDIGTAFATLGTEGSVFIIELLLARKYLKKAYFDLNIIKYFIISSDIFIIASIDQNYTNQIILRLVLVLGIAIFYYFFALLILRDNNVLLLLRNTKLLLLGKEQRIN